MNEYDFQIKEEDQDEINEKLLQKTLKLIPYTQPLDFLSKPENTMFTNLFHIFKLNRKHISLKKLKESIIKALLNHKGLLCTFNKDNKENGSFNNGIFLDYNPEILPNIEEIKIKDDIDKKELELIFQNNLVIFKHYNSPQINIKLFYNSFHIYLFCDICHTVFDGASIGIFFTSINNIYLDKKIPKDYFIYYLHKYNIDIRESQKYKEDFLYFEKYFIHDKDIYPKYSSNKSNNQNSKMIFKTLSWDDFYLNLSKYFSIPNSKKITNFNIFLLMNILLTNYLFSNLEQSHHELNLTFSGRNWKKEKYSVGCLSTDYPVYYDFTKNKINMKHFYESMKRQLELKNTISRYPFFHSDKGRLPVIIQREGEFFDATNFCGDAEAEIIYDYSKHFNNKCSEFWSPLSVVMTIGENSAKYDIMADGNKYNEKDIDKYIDLIEKSGKFIFENMVKINKDEDIDIFI